MLDMGFSEDIMQIERELPKERQTIMFSATMPDKIVELAKTILHDPVEVSLAVSKPADGIHQSAYICYEAQKMGIIKAMFREKKPQRVIIFAGSKLKVKDLAIALKREGFNVGAMHSDLMQSERDEVMYQFKSQKIDILVATDIVARGIDIDDIQLVVNYDVPHDAEDYVHRIGRTARAGAEGAAVTLVSEKDQPRFREIERFLEKSIDKNPIPEQLGEGPEYKTTGKCRGKGTGRGHGRGRGRGQQKANTAHASNSEKGSNANNGKSRRKHGRKRGHGSQDNTKKND
jgi:superfamily II DNA/RNA helicase